MEVEVSRLHNVRKENRNLFIFSFDVAWCLFSPKQLLFNMSQARSIYTNLFNIHEAPAAAAAAVVVITSSYIYITERLLLLLCKNTSPHKKRKTI
jgi:hypothetical protein